MEKPSAVSRQTLKRLPLYINYIRSLPPEVTHVSSTDIATSLLLNPVQVRKDLASLGCSGRPRTGYEVRGLAASLAARMSGSRLHEAVLVGLGHLGRALAAHGFADYGVELSGLFDNHPGVVGGRYFGHTVQDISLLPAFCETLLSPVGIITVPEAQAQDVCNLLVAGKVKAILNFAPACLSVPEDVVVMNEDIGASLALLSDKLSRRSGEGESA